MKTTHKIHLTSKWIIYNQWEYTQEEKQYADKY